MSDAYDALVEAMAFEMYAAAAPLFDFGAREVDFTPLAVDALDAVLSTRLQQPCETCDGTGVVDDETHMGTILKVEDWAAPEPARGGRIFVRHNVTGEERWVTVCEACHGTGTVLADLAIVQVLIERGVLLDTNRHGLGNGEMLYRVVTP